MWWSVWSSEQADTGSLEVSLEILQSLCVQAGAQHGQDLRAQTGTGVRGDTGAPPAITKPHTEQSYPQFPAVSPADLSLRKSLLTKAVG